MKFFSSNSIGHKSFSNSARKVRKDLINIIQLKFWLFSAGLRDGAKCTGRGPRGGHHPGVGRAGRWPDCDGVTWDGRGQADYPGQCQWLRSTALAYPSRRVSESFIETVISSMRISRHSTQQLYMYLKSLRV